MAVTNEQKIDFLLKKIGFTKTKTGSTVGSGSISGTGKQPFAEAIPSPLVVPNSSLWNEAGSIPATAPGSDTTQVKVYLAASSGLRMTADATSSGQRAYIAYTTYNDTSSARLTNWIDTQFGASYLIKVYKGDPNSGGVALSAAGSGANDGWFFDYSAGVLNFNDTFVPSGVTDTNIYIVGYRYIGQTGAPTSGISTFSHLDLTVERNLDVGKQGGISTFRNNIDLNADLDVDGHTNLDNVSVAGVITATTFVGNGDFVELDVDGHTNLDNLSVAGVSTFTGDTTFSGNVSIGGTLTYEDVVNVDAVGLITARSGIRVTGGVIEALAGENKIPSLYAAMGNLPSAGSYHGMFAHVHATGRGYFAHAGNWYELVNKEVNGVVGTGTETYNIGNLVSVSSTATSFNVTGVTTVVTLDVNGDIDVDGHTNLDNLSIAGVSTFASAIDLNADLDVDGHTNLDNVSIAGITTMGNNLEVEGNTGITIRSSNPRLVFTDTDSGPDFSIRGNGGQFRIRDDSASADRLIINNQGNFDILQNLDVRKDLDVNGHTNLDNVSISGFTTITQDLDVDGHTNLDNVSIAGVVTATTFVGNGDFVELDVDGHTNLDNLSIAGVSTFAGAIDLNDDLDVDGHTNLDNVSIAGVTTFSGKIGVYDGTTGANGQYLRATGTGVTWGTFPTMRTSQTFTASAGQTTFSFTYNVGFLDVYVNGVKLSSSEFTASNGTSVVLSVGSFVGDIVELISFFTTSYAAGGGGGGTLSNIVEDTTPQLGGNLDLFNKTITGTGNINITGVATATKFVGDGSGLTGVTGSGSGVGIRNSGSTVGTAGTIDFGDNLSVSPISAGIVTITGSAGVNTSQFNVNKLDVSGISTFSGNIDVNADLDVDGHTNLDNVSIAGVVTATTFVGAVTGNATGLSGTPNISVGTISGSTGTFSGAIDANGDLDVDGHTELDNVNIAGVVTATTFKGALQGTSGTFSSGVDITGDLDVDGHTDLDNVSIAGVVTATSFSGPATQVTVADESSDTSCNVLFTTAATGNLPPKTGTNLTFNSSTGNLTATKFTGDGSGLTGVTASGSGVVVQHDGSNVGTAGTINFSTNLDVSAISAGIVTITASGGGFSPDAQGNLVAGTNAGDSFSGTDANHNVLLGLDAGTAITTADGCVFIGQNAGEVNTTRGGLVAIGDNSGTKVNNAYGFTAVGGGAGKNHQTGQYSVYIGFNAGTQFTGSATDNTIIGGEAHYNAQSGSYNVSVGKQAMSLAADANNCTAVGTKALQTSSQGGSGGDNNTALGYEAGDQLVTGSNCTILGFNAQASSTSVSNEITLGNANVTKFRIPGIGVTFKDNGGTPTQGHVLTVDANGEASFAAASGGGGGTDVGITTNLSGSFTASAGTPSTINTFTGYSSDDLVVEYTVYIKNGSDFQTQKLLAMRDGTTIHSTQFAVMFSSSLLVQCDATISSGNILLRATPETGVSGSTTYKIKREVM